MKVLGSIVFVLTALGTTQLLAQSPVTSSSVGFGSYAGQKDPTLNKLSCGLALNANLGINHLGNFSGTGYGLQLALDANYGSIGTAITFTNPSNNVSANILQTVSGAGSAWQNSYFLNDLQGDRLIVFNQAAGNSYNQQWGYSNVISNLTETGWNPMWSDHYHPNFSKTGTATYVPTSPCYNTGFHFDDSHTSIVANPIETPYGNVTHITNSFQLKSLVNQNWGSEAVAQGLYLNGVVAAQSNLSVIIVGKSGWVEGPINPLANFVVTHADGSCGSSGCSWYITPDVDYVLLQYNVGGANFDLIMRDPYTLGMTIMTSTPYCTPSGNPASCGAISIGAWMAPSGPVSIPQGQVRTYQLEYYAGTGSQLNALGFNVFTGTTVANYNPGVATSCASNVSAESNNQLGGFPVTNLVSNSSFYSSNSFPSAVNSNGTYAAVGAASYGLSHIQLLPRSASGTPLAFPSVYNLYTATTDGSKVVNLGVFNTQPDKTGVVDIRLGYKLNSNYLSIIPATLGQDNYSIYYLQLAKFQVCN